jgi:hypothetical protein
VTSQKSQILRKQFKKVDQNQSLLFLRNCGFIGEKVPLSTVFKTSENKIEPNFALMNYHCFSDLL